MLGILDFIFCKNLQVPLIAVFTVILTGVLKLPIKQIAAKMKNGQKLTKFITFMPIITGFVITVLIFFLRFGEIDFDEKFFTNWLSAVSLSLAIYAFWEKFVPTEKKILTQMEINDNKLLVEELKNTLTENREKTAQNKELPLAEEEEKAAICKKIIIKNNKKEN